MSLDEAGSNCKVKLEELATKARSRAEVIKAAEQGVKDASLDVKASCDEQRARIESVFKEVSFELNFFFAETILTSVHEI